MLRELISLLLMVSLVAGMLSCAEEYTAYGTQSEYASGYSRYSIALKEGTNYLTITGTSDDPVRFSLYGGENVQPAEIEGEVQPGSSYTAELSAAQDDTLIFTADGGAYTLSLCAGGIHGQQLTETVLRAPDADTSGVSGSVCPLCGQILEYNVLAPTGESSAEAVSALPDLTYDFVQEDDLIIYIDRTALTAGITETVYLTVLWGGDVTESITVTDETGSVIAQLENDLSGYCKFEYTIFEEADRSGSFTATSGSFESTPVYFKVMLPLTEGMTATLFKVFEDSDAYIDSQGLQDAGWSELLDAYETYLASCPDVAYWERSETQVIFITNDGLTGAFGSNEHAEGVDGFADAKDTFDKWVTEGTDTSGKYLKSGKAPTNSNIRLYVPESYNDTKFFSSAYLYSLFGDDSIVRNGSGGYYSFEGYDLSDDVLKRIDDAEFVNAAVSILSFHGVENKTFYVLKRRLEFVLGEFTINGENTISEENTASEESTVKYRSKAELDELLNGLYKDRVRGIPKEDDPDKEQLSDDTEIIVQYDSESGTYSLRATSAYLINVLGDKVFDNTIVYMLTCFGLCDYRLTMAFRQHGAACIIGVQHQNHDTFYGIAVFSKFMETLATQKADGKYHTLAEALDAASNMGKDESHSLLNYYASRSSILNSDQVTGMGTEHDRQWDEEVLNDPKYRLTAYLREDTSDMVLYGQAALMGRVVCEMLDGTYEAVPEADVTIYRWMNHKYTESDSQKTDGNGCYLFYTANVGLYGITAEKEDGLETETAELGKDGETVKDIILYKEIEGTVMANDTNKPLSGATVKLTRPDGNVEVLTTDENGHWYAKVTSAEYSIAVSCPGYIDNTATFSDFDVKTVFLEPEKVDWGVTIAAQPNDDAVWLYMVETDPETGLMRLVNGKFVGTQVFYGTGWYGSYDFRLTLVKLSENTIYLEIADLSAHPKYMNGKYEIYQVTDDGFKLLTSVHTDTHDNETQYVNAYLEDGTLGSDTVKDGVEAETLTRAFADYGLTFEYGFHIYSHTRKHDMNYSYLNTAGRTVLIDIESDYTAFPLLGDLYTAAENAFTDTELTTDNQLKEVYDTVTNAIGTLDQQNQREHNGSTTYTYKTPAGCELLICADADGNITWITYYDTALYKQKLYKSTDEIMALGVSDEMTKLWYALEGISSLNLAGDGFTPAYTQASTELPYRQVFTQTEHVKMAKMFHTVTEDFTSMLDINIG